MGFPLRFLSSLSLCLLALLLHRATVTSGCFSMEREALLDFKAGIHDTHNRLSSWVGQDCCTWKGVTCDTTTGHVVMLDLRNTFDRALRGERMMNSFYIPRQPRLALPSYLPEEPGLELVEANRCPRLVLIREHAAIPPSVKYVSCWSRYHPSFCCPCQLHLLSYRP
ncbi:unnamed protein product [Musa acuminata subsp. malaccensis]|uniref:(wild Malaysian banana) hypothetical protein n=1 Tax=Musa acuminata subsp. malaccensis TaxID=214687 RepID=A0A804KR29_MUSAM|nr:unnamed protein product [Musa acuminata subsp. malaccensis]